MKPRAGCQGKGRVRPINIGMCEPAHNAASRPRGPLRYSSGVGRLVELQVSGEDLALRLALRSVDAGRGSGRG
jgi:hypothetical protein